MSGNRIGGIKASAKNRELYGDDYYVKLGALGGKAGHSGGFASTTAGKDGLTGRERASKVGAIGGKKSKRSREPMWVKQ